MIKITVTAPIGYSSNDLRSAVSRHIPVEIGEIRNITVLKRSLVLTDKSNIHYKLTLGLSFSEERESGLLKMKKKVTPAEIFDYKAPNAKLKTAPVVVGAGPAGLFAALVLAESGAQPTVLERGLSVDERKAKVDLFASLGILDPECNVQFGEGGAGTYSDGKLKVGEMNKYKMKVLREFCDAGAESEILFSTTAHIGTDRLSGIIKKIREKIIYLGGKFIFSAKLTDIKLTSDGKLSSAIYEKNGEIIEIPTDALILATGHSAHDVFSMLERHGVEMSAKGFGIGMRVEHPREYINKLVYGEAPPCGIETASYHLVTHLKNGRSVYSFCMCPGGTVVPAASDHFGVVTNGMSELNRDGDNSNAAILVSLTPNDFPDDSPLSGIALQRSIEHAAYRLSGDYKAPAIALSDFLSGSRPRSLGSVKPTYLPGVICESPESYLPEYITESMKAGFHDFDEWLSGFVLSEAVLTGPETRSTSPVRIARNSCCHSVSVYGLYPAGEGAGYSGGIVSSAVDGIKCAEALIADYSLSD